MRRQNPRSSFDDAGCVADGAARAGAGDGRSIADLTVGPNRAELASEPAAGLIDGLLVPTGAARRAVGSRFPSGFDEGGECWESLRSGCRSSDDRIRPAADRLDGAGEQAHVFELQVAHVLDVCCVD
jgi:hypothetical protein